MNRKRQIAGVLLLMLLLTVPLYPQASTQSLPQTVVPDPVVASMLAQVDADDVLQHDRELAGELPVWVDGDWYTITTRYTYSGTPIQKAGRYVGQRMADLGMDVEYHVWDDVTNPNVIGEMPGLSNPDDIYIIGGHLDAVQGTPGADDNASGSVATMLAADILSQYQWGCTLRFAFWTGEEQWMLGSEAYVQRAYNIGENILGYLNLDMIAYNTVGTPPGIDLYYRPDMPATLQLAQLLADVVDAYNLDLIPDIRVDTGGGSDQEPFWDYGYTAILAIEDESDFNPQYHQPGDTPANNDLAYFTQYVKASLGTFAHMTGCLISEGIGALDGHVTDAGSGAPIPDVTVTMLGQGGANIHTTTDPSGYYTQTLLADTYTVTAEAYAYLPAVITGVVVLTDSVTTQDVVLQPAPTYVISGTVTEAGSGAPLAAEIAFEGSPVVVTTDPATGYYEAALPAGAYTMHVRAEGHRSQERPIVVDGDQVQAFELEPLPCILLVDDDNNAPDVRPYYQAALDALGYAYDVFVASGGTGPSAAEMEGYDMVIWFSGDAFSSTNPAAGPNAEDEEALAAYLDGGGRLFLSSQDYLYDMGLTSFGQSYLGIGSYSNDSGHATAKYGVVGDPIGDGLGPYVLTYPSGFSDYGDVVNAGAGGSVAFRSAAAGGNNLDVDRDGGDWKTVFFGTSWVPIQHASAANGQAVMERIVEWFGGCACEAPQNVAFEWWPLEPAVGETVTFTGTAESEFAVGYTWDLGDGGDGHGAVTRHVYSAAGDYSVTMTATNACDRAVVSETLTVVDLPCEPVEILTVTVATDVCRAVLEAELGGSPPFTYTWELGAWGIHYTPVATATVDASGTYPYTLTVTNCGGGVAAVRTGTFTVECLAQRWSMYLPLVVRGQ
ncbi:MAG: M28 family peptidase [Anaerolineae bacterium]|nr:M28 family peptidase [Anaerolineae bacterium]